MWDAELYTKPTNAWGQGLYFDTLECVHVPGMDPLNGYLPGQFDMFALDPPLLASSKKHEDRHRY